MQYAIPAVALAFGLVFAGLLMLPSLLADDPPPSPVGRWVGTGEAGTRLELLDGGRLGPSVVPAAACEDSSAVLPTADLLEVADGTWEDHWETDSGYLVEVRFDRPRRCLLMFTNSADKGTGRRLLQNVQDNPWDLRPSA